MKAIKINYIYLVILTLVGCTKTEIIDQYASDNNLFFPSGYYQELPKDTIDKKIEGYDLNVTSGAHGDLLFAKDTVSIDLPNVFSARVQSKRVFSYYIPTSLKDNYRIMFELHGNFEPTDTFTYQSVTSVSSYWKDAAEANNVIVIQPIGSSLSGNYGFFTDNKDQCFIDILIELFKKQLKEKRGLNLDMKSIYSTGTSSGGIFSFQLALIRNNLMAAVVPRYGSVAYKDYMATKINYRVPMRVYTGKLDQRVSPTGVIENTARLAINGYKLTDPPLVDSLQCKWFPVNGRPNTTKAWRTIYSDNSGGLVEIYLLEKSSHSQLYGPQMCPEIMKFMVEHSKK